MKTAIQELIELLKELQLDARNSNATEFEIGMTFAIGRAETKLQKEKEQLIKAHIDGFDHIVVDFKKQEYAEQYYNQTYKPETI